MLLALFATLFILIDGRGIWRWIVGVFPRRARAAVDGAGTAGWATLQNFVKVQILVATIDAIGIGLGAFLLGGARSPSRSRSSCSSARSSRSSARS